MAESLRVHEEQQLQAARELSLSMSRECGTGGSEEELLKQAMQVSGEEKIGKRGVECIIICICKSVTMILVVFTNVFRPA